MSNEAANVKILEEAYHQWQETRGDSVDHWLGIVDDDIQFGSLAEGEAPMAFATSYTRRDQLGAYFTGLLNDWSMVHYTTKEFVAQGDTVVMRGSCAWTNKRTSKTVETPKIDFWRFRDGKAVEYYEYYDTAKVYAAAI
ncbi:nuclear transport factor 2 family protein [Bradyrhizobium prioriisuperbiae]|uniref:nuclear transport factor 2 family protein n=1 Tax=Bradyrhizobium prioriisuperbiae TaxID=2854389 RepID=UPI0028E97F6A|nr:nuclear transport factor 2 family protein [Bradyrhizobium prioritasuperba]